MTFIYPVELTNNNNERKYIVHRDIHLEIGTLSGAQSTHPEIGEDDLTAGVSKKRPMIGGYRERKARLAGPVL